MTAAIALGSNQPSPWGDSRATLQEALRRLPALGELLAVSSFYRTAPVGYLDQPAFLNAATLLATTLGPLPLLRELLAIEHGMGRDRSASPPKGPRVIDLDLLLYFEGDRSEILRDPDLILPHPALHERRFVLEPLAELAPGLVHPVLGRTVLELLNALPSASGGESVLSAG